MRYIYLNAEPVEQGFFYEHVQKVPPHGGNKNAFQLRIFANRAQEIMMGTEPLNH